MLHYNICCALILLIFFVVPVQDSTEEMSILIMFSVCLSEIGTSLQMKVSEPKMSERC
jgi:hypothetical protein